MRAIAWMVLAALVALALAGCQNSASVRLSSGHDFVQLQGAELVLKRDLRVPPRHARVFVQNGRPVRGFDNYEPHCAFEIDRVDHDGYQIRADHFEIVRVEGSLQRVVSADSVLVAGLVADLGLTLGSGIGGADGGGAYHEGYHFWLVSARQSEVLRMSCYGAYAESYELYPPTLREIQGALGDVAEIRR